MSLAKILSACCRVGQFYAYQTFGGGAGVEHIDYLGFATMRS